MGLNVIYIQNQIPELNEEQTAMFASANWVNPLPECRVIDGVEVVQALASTIEELEQFKEVLTQLGKFVSVIGIWDTVEGLQYGYKTINTGTYEDPVFEIVRKTETDMEGNESLVPIDYPFNITEYKNYLNNIVTYDEDGNILTSIRPNEDQAKYIQVNVFGGNPNSRDLNTYT